MKKLLIFLFFAQSIVAQTNYDDCEERPFVKKDFVKEISKCFNTFEAEQETIVEISFFITKNGDIYSPTVSAPEYINCVKTALERCGKFSPCFVNRREKDCFVKFKIRIKG